jgi:fucose permease
MSLIILIIIYIAFISLGLPDALIGSAWPAMYLEFGVSQSFAGIIVMLVSGGTIISSFLAGRLLRLGTGKLTFLSTLITAAALTVISLSKSVYPIIAIALPLGFGAGAVDAALNNYVSLHYKARQMNWLHCFWGVGAMTGPIVMSFFLAGSGWQGGYRVTSIVQFSLAFILLLSLPLWNKAEKGHISNPEKEKIFSSQEEKPSFKGVFKLKGIFLVLLPFLFYCALEYSAGLWGATYLVTVRGLEVSTAALWISFYYGGITSGRFLTGILTSKISNAKLIRIGLLLIIMGIILIILPLNAYFALTGFILIGLGAAPVYPSMLYETPKRFGRAASGAVMGVQMGTAYLGATFMPSIVGFIAGKTSFSILPFALLLFALIMLFGTEIFERQGRKKEIAA